MALFSFAAAVASQIGFLLSSLNSANYKSVLYELGLLLDYGPAGNLLLQSCLEQGNLNEGEVQSFPINLKIELLGILIRYLIQQPNFSSIFTEAVRLIPYREDFVDNLAVLLKLSLLDQIGIGLALTDAEDPNWRRQGQVFCEAKILQLIKTPAPGVSEGVLDQILLFLYESEGLSEHVPEFVKALSVLQPKAHSSILLAPLLHDKDEEADCVRDIDSLCAPLPDAITADLVEQLGNAVNAADVMEELGYSCTVDVAHCKNILNLFAPLNETAVAKLVGMISRTHTGLVDTHGIHGIFCSALCNSATSYTSWLQTWNIDVLLEAIAALAPGISWVHVAEELDHKEFYLSDQKSFNLLLEIFRKAIQDPFPLEVVTQGLWKNSEGQLSFLRFAVKSAPELFSRQVPIEGLDVYEAPNDNSNHVWSSVALIKILCQLAEAGHTDSVRSLLEYPAKHFPETLILGLVQVKTVNNLMQQEIFLSLFPLYLGMNPINHSVLQHIWSYNREMMMFGMVELYSRDTNIISRVLHTCQELKVLGSVLEATPFSFSIELAVLAYKKDLINLEKWLQEQLKVHRDSFFQACLNFLRKRTTAEVRADGSAISGFGLGSVFPLETLPTFLQVLQSFSSSLVLHDLAEEMKQVHAAAVRVNPHLNSVGPQEQLASEGFSSAIEDESNAYFQQIYAGEMMIQSALQMLESFKDSNSPRERKVFACMIQCLFDEYQYFPKYPDKELKITAVLFGSLIKHQLVSSLTLGMALRHVLDALRKPLDTKMFSFGLTALEQFLDRVVEWPQYCNHILQISHMREARDGIVEFIERGLARLTGQSEQNAPSMTPAIEHSRNSSSQLSAPNAVAFEGTEILQAPHSSSSQQQLNGQNNQLMTSFSQGFVRPRSSSALEISRKHPSTAGFGHAFNIETLVAAAERRDTPIEAPMQEVQDKIFFIINNISTANIDPKAKEILEFLEDQYDPWFAEYMVMKRASIEPNFHDLYLKFLDKINSKSLHKEIMKATYENCKVLLRSDLIKSSSEERSLLKNLGSWLGKLTIGRNQPLRAREIDPKVLIIEAYEKGLMIAVVPFTSKVLEPCQSSLAYQPPNPWTMGILALLAEIYALPNLKMNLKFDIEVLLKNLGVDMKDVKPTQLLASRQRDLEGNPDFSNKDLSVMHPLSTFSTTDANSNNDMSMENSNLPKVNSTINHSSSVSQLIASGHLSTEEETVVGLASAERGIGVSGLSHSIPSSSPYSSSQLSMPIPNLSSYVLVNPKLAALGPQLSRIVPSAMERAIREIISPVVDRSVTIACMTTRELVTKDFCLETDESRIRQSANLMVASLAGSLAHVTCKEPLRMAMTNHLRLLLQGLSITGDILEQAVLLVTNDNLDLGCAVIEKAATEKALHDLEEALVNVLAHRRKQAPGFYEAAVYAQRLPEALRPKPGRLSNVQQRVYEDFARLPWQNQSPQSSAVGSASLTTPSNMPSAPGVVRANFPGQNSFRMIPGSQPGVGLDGAASDEADPRLPTSLSLPSSGSILLVEGGARQLMDTSASFVPPESTTTEGFSPETNIMNEAPSTLPSSTPVDQLVVNSADQLLTTAEAMDKFETVVSKLDMAISKASARGSLSAGQDQDIQAVISEIPDIISKCTSKDETALACAQKILKRLYEQSLSSLHVSTHIAVLVVIRDACNRIVKELTSWVIYSDEEWKFNREIIVGLIRSELINLAEYNVHLANLMDSGRSAAAIEFAIYLIQTLVIQEAGVTASEMLTIIDALAKIAQIPSSPPESLQQLLDIVKNSISSLPQESGTNSGKDDKLKLSKEKRPSSSRGSAGRDEFKTMIAAADPAGLQEQVAVLFEEWARICDAPGSNDKTYAIYISQLQHTGFLKGDDVSDRFFRILTELAVTHCLNSEMAMSNTVSLGPPQGNLFAAIDMYAKLVVLLVKYYSVDPAMSKVNLLNRVLSVTARVVQRDGDEKKTTFHPRPYFRLFVTWLMEFNTTESTLDAINFQVLTAFANTFVQLQPLRVPGFSFAWLELISHRMFMPKLLLTASQKGWPFVQRLLVSLFKFMEPYLRSAELNDPVRLLYKGSLRVLLVLLHDFPEFLCENHFSFCDVIPPSCIQMRNLILSAFPRNMRLPDPFTPNLKVDLLPEISQSPRISSDVEFALKNKQLKAEIDDYLKTRQPLSLRLVDLKQRLMLPLSEADAAGTRYNVPLINALVLYVGMQAIQQLQSKTTPQQLAVPTAPITHSAPMDIFQRLSVELDTEGRYLFLNAVANQLRYPNNHTHYFSCVLLYLFAEANQEIIQEQITRVLLERLIVNRPHPWGLLITFIELIKNPRYNFWNHSFVHCAPEIDKLFESVARSCMGPPMKSVEEDMASTIGVEGLKG